MSPCLRGSQSAGATYAAIGIALLLVSAEPTVAVDDAWKSSALVSEQVFITHRYCKFQCSGLGSVIVVKDGDNLLRLSLELLEVFGGLIILSNYVSTIRAVSPSDVFGPVHNLYLCLVKERIARLIHISLLQVIFLLLKNPL
jgi:hypothetical protein